MNEIEQTVTRVKRMLSAGVEAARQRARAEREIAQWLERDPSGFDRLVGDLERLTFTEIEEVK